MEETSEKSSKIFFLVFLMIVVSSVFATYYRFFISKNYEIVLEEECDPLQQSCFVYRCDPDAEECTGDPLQDTSYYRKIQRKAFAIPMCDPKEEQCAEKMSCAPGESGCRDVFCDPNHLLEGEECGDVEEYKAMLESSEMNTSEGDEAGSDSEEGVECVSGDESCEQSGADAKPDDSEDAQDISKTAAQSLTNEPVSTPDTSQSVETAQ